MTGDTFKLFKWSVCTRGNDFFTPPECMRPCLHGFREEADGSLKEVSTSYMVEVDGRNITTYSGSVYTLQDIAPEYLQYLHD